MRKIIFFSTLILLVGILFYTYWNYYFVYDEGKREGVLQEFSYQGNLFKTYEGNLVLLGFGARNGNLKANYFNFSVVDKAVAEELESNIGKIVTVHYVKYRRSLPWRGKNHNKDNNDNGQYIVDKVVSAKENTERNLIQ